MCELNLLKLDVLETVSVYVKASKTMALGQIRLKHNHCSISWPDCSSGSWNRDQAGEQVQDLLEAARIVHDRILDLCRITRDPAG
jgi:hypothetical protein